MDIILSGDNIAKFLLGLLTTLELTAAFIVFGGLIGVILAALRSLPVKPLQWLVALFVLYHRNVPLLVQILFWYFAIPQVFPPPLQKLVNGTYPEFILGATALSMAFGAYVSEDLRSGFRSLPKVQFEASRAIGMSFLQSFVFIILPQAVRVATPALTNQLLLFFKGTSLASVIGVAEITHVASDLNTSTLLTFESFFIATMLYLTISLIIVTMGRQLTARAAAGTRS
ncbi:amino acid ABC transporter permease [Pelagibacterium sediminicola]|uniref:amino acid ABC transporter permease n=1 Tax=Pelagibacterium sediminicola TaxID=2248761 RepID=UPI000E3159AB|nr:amino acid ABC transporter permease [Pelagibacterium sediminicola]